MNTDRQPQWQLLPTPEMPQWFIDAVKPYSSNLEGNFGAQLLWQRGIKLITGVGFHSSNVTCYKVGYLHNAVTPQPTKYLMFKKRGATYEKKTG